jgi:hypothetical protein
MLFVGPPLSGVQVYNPNLGQYVTAYPVSGMISCNTTDSNAIYSYDRLGTENEDVRVGIVVSDGAVVDVSYDQFMTTEFVEGLDWVAIGADSFATNGGTNCPAHFPALDPFPGPPVQ